MSRKNKTSVKEKNSLDNWLGGPSKKTHSQFKHSDEDADVAKKIQSTQTIFLNNDFGQIKEWPLSSQLIDFMMTKPISQPFLTEFPSKIVGNQQRRFSSNWYICKDLTKRIWISYSESTNKAFCGPCFIFFSESVDNRKSLSWSKEGFDDWKNALRLICEHEQSEIHLTCMFKYVNYKKLNIDHFIDSRAEFISSAKSEKISRNRTILQHLIEIILLFARQNIAFRGTDKKGLCKGFKNTF